MKKVLFKSLIAILAMSMMACEPTNGPEQPQEPVEENEQPAFLDKSTASEMVVFVGEQQLVDGMEITLSEAEENADGDKIIYLRGEVLNVEGFRMTATRADAGYHEEFCSGSSCMPGNEEATQDFDIFLRGGAKVTDWQIHFYPQEGTQQVVKYTFKNHDRELTLKVTYKL